MSFYARSQRALESHRTIYILLGFYGLLSILAVKNTIGYLNSDGIAYARLVSYLFSPDWPNFITSYWSPLYPLLASFFTPIFDDPVLQLKIINIVSGGLILLIFFYLLRKERAFKLLTLLATAALSLVVLRWATLDLTPDLLLAACLLAYFTVALDKYFSQNSTLTFLAGVFGGVAFLAKSYAFPFFLVHYLFTFFWGARMNQQKIFSKNSLIKLSAGLLGFLLIAIPWIGLMSVRYGVLTINSSGAATHALSSPAVAYANHPLLYGLWEPSSPRLTVWEDPVTLPYSYWSPFKSVEYFKHQANLIRENTIKTVRLINHGRNLSSLVLIIFLIACYFVTRNKKYLWFVFTAIIFLVGYVMTAATDDQRYFWPIMILLYAGLVAAISEIARKYRDNKIRAAGWKIFFILAAAYIVSTISYQALRDTRYLLLYSSNPNQYKIFTSIIRAHSLDRVIVASDDWSRGLYASYYLGEVKYLGVPDGKNGQELDSEVNMFISWRQDSDIFDKFSASSRQDWQIISDDSLAGPENPVIYLKNTSSR